MKRDVSAEIAALRDVFLKSAAEELEKLGAALASGDRKVASRVAHGIRGTAGAFGEHALGDACGRIEDAIRGAPADAPPARSELETHLAVARAHLAAVSGSG